MMNSWLPEVLTAVWLLPFGFDLLALAVLYHALLCAAVLCTPGLGGNVAILPSMSQLE
jgi:hypothetical protein